MTAGHGEGGVAGRAQGGPWRVATGELARLTPEGPAAAEVTSGGFLPLRARVAGAYRLRAAFPGTAVVLGDATFEVASEEALPGGGVVYRLVPWPEGEVVRDRVVYGPRFVRAVLAERRRAGERERYRPFRFVLYPLVGLLPEEHQERLCDRMGMYAVTATLVSGLAEMLLVVLVFSFASFDGRPLHERPVVWPLFGAAVWLSAVPGFVRALGALLLRETAGSPLVSAAFDLARALGRTFEARDDTVVPLTRTAFWARLGLPDRVMPQADGVLRFQGLLPHVSWRPGTRIRGAGGDYWQVEPLPPTLDRGRLVYAYDLVPLSEVDGASAPTPPAPSAYADEVLARVGREWDDLMRGFAWLVSLLPLDAQRRALDRLGGPPAIRRWTRITAVVSVLFALYILQYVVRDPPADPLRPWMGILGLALLVDGAWRLRLAAEGRYAPSVLRFVLPCEALRPERLAYHEHRDAERAALATLRGDPQG